MAENEEETTTNVIVGETSRAHDQTEIEIEEENLPSNDDVVASIVEELTRDVDIDYIEKLRSSETVTMCRVPEEIIQANGGGDFEPKMISIGPYHSKNEALYPMQNLKLRYLNDLLLRNIENNKVETVETYTKAVKEQLSSAKAKYCEFDACGISDAEFLKMLVLDGCFIVELLLKYAEGPTFVLPGIDIDLLNHDLILIENQVPFSVLQVIYLHTEHSVDHEKWIPKQSSFPPSVLPGFYIEFSTIFITIFSTISFLWFPPEKKLPKKFSIFDLAVYYLEKRKKNIGVYSEVKEDGEVDHLLHLLYIVRLSHFKTKNPSVCLTMVRDLSAMVSSFISAFLSFLGIYIVTLLSYFIIIVEASYGLIPFQEILVTSPSVMTPIPTTKEVSYAGMRFFNIFNRPYNMFYFWGIIEDGQKEIDNNFFTEFENMLFYEQIYAMETREMKTPYKYNNRLFKFLYENFYQKSIRRARRSNISTYTVYMSHLVKSDVDVDVLTRNGFLKITTTTKGAKEIAEFFSKSRPWLVLPEKQVDFLSTQFQEINCYCSELHRRLRAEIMKYYFTSPLIILSFIGFMMILSLTAVQAVFSILK